jgi:hypothetical protein
MTRESRLKTTAGGTYTYDGNGVRVKKASAGAVIDQALCWGSSFTTGPLSETNLPAACPFRSEFCLIRSL